MRSPSVNGSDQPAQSSEPSHLGGSLHDLLALFVLASPDRVGPLSGYLVGDEHEVTVSVAAVVARRALGLLPLVDIATGHVEPLPFGSVVRT